MRYLLIALLGLFSTLAFAQGETPAPTTGTAATAASETYDYSQDLDIAKVVRVSSESSTECGPVKGHMVYIDSHGVRHELDYMRLGDACQHG
ncbi:MULTISPECIES: DUF2790 domain-containing protein [unclassified Pseudomonas]|uniref:DUF2790 domain-containing protein n=1 Tax=unclassified Pseudomonas TaxID=196821 RepID=UPI0015A0C048|nr:MULTISPECIES: DUF2790 domain-containing protein [unclassified Pseudomonas]NWC92962.1 DUF2790 domain-containing protein [Pseudomonas sp. IPO3779]NWD19380.1 DUF2790 domain-containing protein [Pseudomonas sp. IPO3778]